MTSPTSGSGRGDVPDRSALLRGYGEALVRINELEGEMTRLRQLADRQAPEPTDPGPMKDRGLGPLVGDADNMEQLRLRLATLSRQLDQARQGLGEVPRKRERSPRRNRTGNGRVRHRRWWRLWRRSGRL